MGKINGGRLVAKVLKHEGVECIFTLPGGQIDSIFQGCLDENIRIIDTSHEQAAVFMAEGWARVTGRPGVAVVSAGPGVTNAITGMCNALGTGSPVIVFGGRSPLKEFEGGSPLDLDSLPIVKTVTKWARSGYETKRVAEYVSMAFRQALGGRPGPAYLEFPMDVLEAEVEEDEVALPKDYRTAARAQGDPSHVHEAIDLLLGAERPLVIAGSGVWWSQAATELQEFIELTKIPVACVDMGQGSLPADHPLCLGNNVFASGQADVVLLLGTRINSRFRFGRPSVPGENSKWIQVDIEAAEIGRNYPINIGIIADAKAVLRQMIQETQDTYGERKELPWVEECREQLRQREVRNEALMNSGSVPVLYTRLCKEIRDFIDRDATVVIDGGEIAAWGIRSIKSYQPGHTLGVAIGNSWTLGVGTAFAMAARLARPDKQVLLLSGDGSFGLNAMEFNTMVSHNLPIVCVIGNDGAWGAIKRSQQAKGFEVIGTERSFVRYEKVVEALGGYGEAVDRPDDIRPALERAFASGLPACINVKCTSVPL